MHRDLTACRPFAKRVVMDTEVFRCFRSLEVVSQFGHALGLFSKERETGCRSLTKSTRVR